MKKIFAIALALVMVLSMASAFASACVTGPFTWGCTASTTNCAKATVEVIPYVKTNAACDKVSYVQSDCAAAVNGENVYFAIKMTVPADVDREWLDISKLTLSIKGMQSVNGNDSINSKAFAAEGGWKHEEQLTADKVNALKNEDKSEDGWVFYYKLNGTGTAAWTEVTELEDFDIATVMNQAVVKEYAKAKVCATIESEYTPGTVRVGDYTIKYNASVGKLWVANKTNTVDLVTYTIKNEKVTDIEYNKTCGEAEYATIKAFMGLDIGTCVTTKDVKANFGWKDKAESCFAWKTQNAMAVVDAECVVAIPKTGDASVLAWLF